MKDVAQSMRVTTMKAKRLREAGLYSGCPWVPGAFTDCLPRSAASSIMIIIQADITRPFLLLLFFSAASIWFLFHVSLLLDGIL